MDTARGELVLRREGDRFEIVSNGVFLMDTSDGSSERLIVDAALHRCSADRPRVLIGGLGVGFSLVAAVEHESCQAIDVVELEPVIIGWHHRFLMPISGVAFADPRVGLIPADVLDHLAGTEQRYDAICLDIDNGPNWLVYDANAELYSDRGLGLVSSRLAPGGVLTVWSASRDPAYEVRLRRRFPDVEVLEVARPRGDPDLVYVARARWA